MEKAPVQISGSVDTVIFTNEDNGYTVLRLALDKGGLVTVVGTLPYATPGEKLNIEGEWSSHQYHGDQFKALSFERLMPASVTKFLITSPRHNKRNRAGYGESYNRPFRRGTLRVLEEEPELLVEIKR
jgi:exodeoxyribonuclease V alpha subunit